MPLRQLAPGIGNENGAAGGVDIVAIHGLNPWNRPEHALDTWRKPQGAEGNLWLRDNLPQAVPSARVFLYEYESSPAFGSTKERFVHQANDLLENLRIERRKTPKKVLIFVGHSLGGILIKQALVNAHNNPKYSLIRESTQGLAFFGTPHGGGKETLVTLGNACARIVTALSTNPSNDIIEVLRSGSLFSDILQENWRHQLSSYKIVSFYEGIGEIVPRSSAVLGLPGDVENQVKIQADHSDMCRFDLSQTSDQDNYRLVQANIEDLCDSAAAQGLETLTNDYLTLTFDELQESKKTKKAVLHSLHYSEMFDRYESITEAYERTFAWIFDDPGPGFVTWLREGRQIYWIRGKPGSGKSTLMKFLFEDQRTREYIRSASTCEEHVMVDFYFHDRGSTLQKSFSGLLRGILYQLLTEYEDLIPSILPMYNASLSLGGSHTWSSEKELLRALTVITTQQVVRAEVCLFIDGLDEYEGDQLAFLKWMVSLTKASMPAGLQFKMCVSSRQLNIFENALNGFPGFVVQEMTHADISAFVTSKLQAQLVGHSPQQQAIRDTLAAEIVEKASGAFVWVKLVIDELCRGLVEGDSMQELRTTLRTVPTNLEDLYSRILHKIRPENRGETQLLFNIVRNVEGVVSLLDLAMISEPLEIRDSSRVEFIDDVDVESLCLNMKRRLNSRSGGIIEIQNEAADVTVGKSHIYHPIGNASVQIVHQTAKEFLSKSSTWEEVGLQGNESVDINPILLKICLQHYRRKFAHVDFRDRSDPWRMNKALSYAKRVEEKEHRSPIAMIDQIVLTVNQLGRWKGNRPKADAAPIPFLFEIGSAGLDLYLSAKLTEGKLDVSGWVGLGLMKAVLSPFGTPALADMSSPVLKLLLSNGVNPNLETYSVVEGLSAWQVFLMRPAINSPGQSEHVSQWLALATLFLDHGANPNVELPIGTPTGVTIGVARRPHEEQSTYPLHLVLGYAGQYKHPGFLALVTTLLRAGANVNIEDSDGHTVSALAAHNLPAATAMIKAHSSFLHRGKHFFKGRFGGL